MKQRGYSLLLSLFALLSISGFMVVGSIVQKQSRTSDQTLALSLARSALISYAVNYVDHYGSQSAGIGHLPCPDTDTPTPTAPDPWYLDGPNPPCGKHDIEQGWLPRRVDVVNGRYHFHTRAKQRLVYAVSGQFVNNPLGRMVNPSTAGDIEIGNFTDVVAILATPHLEYSAANQMRWMDDDKWKNKFSSYALIRTADIREQSMQRVGAWYQEKLNVALIQRCKNGEGTKPCVVSQHNLPACELSALHTVLHWLHLKSKIEDCGSYTQMLNSAFEFLDDVPLARHWFIRNEWYRFIEVQLDEACLGVQAFSCRFDLVPVAGHASVIHIRLVPNSETTNS